MTLLAWNSFYFDDRGWIHTNTNRSLGTGQNSIGSIRATLGADAAATFGLADKTEIIVGFCLQTSTMGATRIFQFLNSSSVIVAIYQSTAGEIEVYRGVSTAFLGRSVPGVLAANVEAYIEIRLLSHGSTGEVEIRVNGNPTPVVNITGANTTGSAINQIQFYSAAVGTRDHSAFYLLDTLGGSMDDFLGHIRFGILNPSGNGNASDFDGSDGNSTDNYLLVDDGSSPDDATTYVSSSTLNERDTYAMGNMPTPSSVIYAVCPVIRARKSDAGTRAVTPVIRRSGTDYDGDDLYLGLGYDSFRSAVLEDPSTSAPWVDAGVDAMELGPKVSV
jgi:hypothetical protein